MQVYCKIGRGQGSVVSKGENVIDIMPNIGKKCRYRRRNRDKKQLYAFRLSHRNNFSPTE
ncbi:MAG: hypothetical protein L6V93_04905 [Clostridiales bacterium]|nr:MAG: hypothetical protein L6V93_04905 [Clostridiales bacterium]